jgi:hypothetical protein
VRRAWPAAVGLGLGLLALGPGLGRGFLLSYDMVAVPRQPFGAAMFGLSGGPARAVPSDAVLAALSRVIPADLAQKALLLAIFTLACAGAAALLPGEPWFARLAAGVFYTWNPFVAERLLVGQWALLLGYAGLPWVLRAAQALGSGPPWRATGRLALALLPAAAGGFAAMTISALVALPAAAFSAARRRPERDPESRPGPASALPRPAGQREADPPRAPRRAWLARIQGPVDQAGTPGFPPPAGQVAAEPFGTPRRAGSARMRGPAKGAGTPGFPPPAGQRAAEPSGASRRAGPARMRGPADRAEVPGAVLVTAAVTLAVLAVASVPWLIPSLLRPVYADPAGVAAFAVRADTPFGSAGSLAMLGGMWNARAVPAGYGGGWSVLWLAVVVTAVPGFVLLARRPARWPGLGVATLAGLAVAGLGLTGPGQDLLRSAQAVWPGFAVLRDGQQYAAPLALAEALGTGLAAAWLARRPATRPGPLEGGTDRAGLALAACLVLAPVLLLPGLAWGAAGRLRPASYPAGWLAAARMIDRDPAAGAVLVLPWESYRSPDWNGGRTVLDPWPRLVARPVIWNDGPQVGPLRLRPDNPVARRLDGVIRGGGPLTGALRAAGVRFVISDDGGAVGGRLPGAAVLTVSPGLTVYLLTGSNGK